MKATGWIPFLMLVLGDHSLEAQPRASEPRFHFGVASFLENRRHQTAGASYRHYFGKRGWGLEPEYSFMTEGSHQDHMLIMNVVKDLTRPSRVAVLYTILGGGINFYRARQLAMGGLGWGMGVKVWATDRILISPQFRIGQEPNFRFSLYVGLGRRR